MNDVDGCTIMWMYIKWLRDFPGGPVVKNLPVVQGTQVQSLVRELGSHMLHCN